jgi:deoxycytidylate deaminase
MYDCKIFDETFKLAQAVEPVRGARIAATVVRRGKVVSYGYNHKKTHPFQAQFCKHPHAVFFHAEVHAIKNALTSVAVDDLSKCELYIVRAKRNKTNRKWITGMSKPCSGCQKCIDLFDLKGVYYSKEDDYLSHDLMAVKLLYENSIRSTSLTASPEIRSIAT